MTFRLTHVPLASFATLLLASFATILLASPAALAQASAAVPNAMPDAPSVAQLPSPSGSCSPLTGVVEDSTRALLPHATVTLDGGASVESDGRGQFRFDCVTAGLHTVVATAPDFAQASSPVTMPRAEALRFRMAPSAEVSINVEDDGSGGQVAAPGGGNGLVIGGKQLQALADDPDDLLRELQQLAAASGGSPGNTTISVNGFQDGAQLPPKDSIAYINVSPDLFSAEYREPPFGGGRVEVYTKPGAKAFHGAVFGTYSGSALNARDPFTTTQGTVGKQRFGFDFNGPIRKEGSNFSLNFERRSIDETVAVNARTLDAGGNVVPVLDTVPVPQRLWIGSARVDWQFGPKDFAFVTYDARANNQQNLGVGGSTLREAGYASSNLDQTLRASNVTTFTPKLVHESRVSFERYTQRDLPTSTGPSIQVAGYFTGGGASVGNTVEHRSRLEFDDDFILNTGGHAIKSGVQFFYVRRNSNLDLLFNGSYLFPGAQAYLTRTPEQFSSVSGTPHTLSSQIRGAIFFQDDWKLRKNLTMSYGLRYFAQSDPLALNAIAPRLGFAWSPDKKQTWQLKTHFGVFNEQYGADELEELNREDGISRITSSVYNPSFTNPLASGQVIQTRRTRAAGLNDATYVIGDFSVSKDLPKGFNLNVQSVFLRLLTNPRTVNINSPIVTGTILDPYGPRPFGENVNILETRNDGTGQGHGEFIGLSNFKLKHAQFFFGALHLNIRDNNNDSTFNQPQSAYSDAGETARRSNQGEWQTFGNATFQLPGKLQLSGNGYGAGGQPFNLLTGFDNNGDGNFNDRPQFAAPGAVANGQTIFQTPFGLLTNAGPIVNGVPLRPIVRNQGALPWNFHLDANLQRSWKLTRNAKDTHQQTLTANVRSANFLNFTNVTAEGSVLGSPQFLQPVSADNARRIEFGLRYAF